SSTTVWPRNGAMSKTTCVQVLVFWHTLSTVASRWPDVSRIFACSWSKVIESRQFGLYQNVSVVAVAGTVIVCVIVLSPLVASMPPSWAANDPLWTGEVTTQVTAPLAVQPVKSPVSKPPFVPTGVEPPVTVSVAPTLWVVSWLLPEMVMSDGPLGVLGKVVTVSVDEPPEVTGFGLKLTVAPAGSPATDRLTLVAEPNVTDVPT